MNHEYERALTHEMWADRAAAKAKARRRRLRIRRILSIFGLTIALSLCTGCVTVHSTNECNMANPCSPWWG